VGWENEMRFILGLFLTSLSWAAVAQPAPGVPPSAQAQARPRAPDWTMSVGVAPLYAPVWQGSRDMGLSIFPDLRLNYRDDVFLSVPDGLGWNAVNRDGWKLGPLMKLRFGRRETTGGSPFLVTGGSDALIGMGDVGTAGEAGGFAQYALAGGKLRARAEVRQGFGGHEGLVADMSLGWNDAIGSPRSGWRYGLGVRAAFSDRDFSNVYFGVNGAQATATGLAISQTGGGLVSMGVNGSLTRITGRKTAITLFVGHDRLGDTVARSSLIRMRGQRGQTAVGLAYGYRFGWN
jgi:outer membrane scaffolding protein for murein synthesis (MipA/OmpV family)